MKSLVALFLFTYGHAGFAEPLMERVRVAPGGHVFALGQTPRIFRPWGMNYGNAGRLMEDFWNEEWETIAGDFHELEFRLPAVFWRSWRTCTR